MTCFRYTPCFSSEFCEEAQYALYCRLSKMLGKQGVSENWHLRELSGLIRLAVGNHAQRFFDQPLLLDQMLIHVTTGRRGRGGAAGKLNFLCYLR